MEITINGIQVAQTLASAAIDKPASTDEELQRWQLLVDFYFEVLTNGMIEWHKVTEEPEIGKEVLGFNKSWIDEDYNPDGICLCHMLDDKQWFVAKWCGTHDEWHTRECGIEEEQYKHVIEPPTHWRIKPIQPNVI
jgi:hypothetical protein